MNQPQDKSPDENQSRLSLAGLIDSLGQLASQHADPDVELIELKAGEVLFEQGQEADRAYLLIAGVLGVRVNQADGSELVIDKLAPGAVVGELALLSGEKRSATVFAVNQVGLISLSKSRLEQLSAGEQQAIFEEKTVQARIRRLQLTQILGDLIGEIDTAALHSLQSQLEWIQLSKEEVLFEAGQPADGFYFLLSGRLGVTSSTGSTGERVVSEIYPGELIGEFAMLNGDARPARVSAVRESEVVKFPQPVFERLVREHPLVMVKLARSVLERQEAALLRARL